MNKNVMLFLSGICLSLISEPSRAAASKPEIQTVKQAAPKDFETLFAQCIVVPTAFSDSDTSSDEDAELKQIRRNVIRPIRKGIKTTVRKRR